jgi:type I restriction enzyme S subunit
MAFELTTLGAVVDIRGGGTPATDDPRFWNGDIPWVSPKDMKSDEISASADWITQAAIENSAASLIPPGAVLAVVRSGILARTVPVGVTTRPLAVNQDIKALCPGPRILPRFLFYFLLASEPALLARVSRGATVHRLSTDDLRNLPLLLPSLPEQKRIVAIQDEAFEGIRIASANAEKNLANARELFEQMLTREFGAIDAERRQLRDVYAFKNGINFSGAEKGDVGVPTIDVLNMYGKSTGVATSNLYRVNKTISKEWLLAHGDILVVRSSVKREGVGRACHYVATPEPTTYCGFLIRGRPAVEVDSIYATFFLRSRAVRAELVRRATQATITNINQTILGDIQMPLPRLEEQLRVVDRLQRLSSDLMSLERSIEVRRSHLAALRSSILARAFSGQLTATKGLAA